MVAQLSATGTDEVAFARTRSSETDLALERLMGLAIFGEKVAARTYAKMARLEPGWSTLLTKFASMEAHHGAWFLKVSRVNGVEPDRAFAQGELGYLLARRVNVAGIDCVGGTLMNIADSLDAIGMSGADCAGAMMDGYSGLLERVGVESRDAVKNVVSLFVPLMTKYRRGESAK